MICLETESSGFSNLITIHFYYKNNLFNQIIRFNALYACDSTNDLIVRPIN